MDTTPNANGAANDIPLVEQLRICTEHARDLIEAASAVFAVGKPNIAYHLATLALEEIGRHELLTLEHSAKRHSNPPSWTVKQRQDHVRKLFWAFFGAAFASQELTGPRLEEMREFAQFIHTARMAGLYAEDAEGHIQVPSAAIPPEQAQNLINLATARLGMVRTFDPDAPIADADRELQQWFLGTVEDDRRREFIFTGPSMAKLADLGDAKQWLLWLKEQFDEADARGREMIETELARSQNLPTASTKKKWQLRFKLASPSHQVAPRALRKWNDQVDAIKLVKAPSRNELYVDLYFDERMPVQGLYYSGWAQARRFTVALNIGTRGLWWWHFAKDASRYYEIVKDLEQDQTVELDQQPRLALNWGSHLILGDTDLALTQRCLVALPFPHESDKLAPFDYYVAALTFWAHLDVHWRCEIEIYGNFHESLKEMTRHAGAWDGNASFADVMTSILQRLMPDIQGEVRQRYLDLAQAFERHEPEGQNITLTDVAAIKALLDRYFLDVVMPLELEARLKSRPTQ
jgi:AbiV family abortive infection protein